MALRVLKAVLPLPRLTEEDALEVLNYYLERNRVARTSHEKSWCKRHKKVKYKLLL